MNMAMSVEQLRSAADKVLESGYTGAHSKSLEALLAVPRKDWSEEYRLKLEKAYRAAYKQFWGK